MSNIKSRCMRGRELFSKSTMHTRKGSTCKSQMLYNMSSSDQLSRDVDAKNRQREMERQNKDAENRAIHHRMQEQQMLQEVMKDQEKALKSHLHLMNMRQMEENQQKNRMKRFEE